MADVVIDYDDWDVTFRPVEYDGDGDGSGLMWETYGPDVDQIKLLADREPGRVWTALDDGHTIVNGMHFVNRLGYHITEVACRAGETVTVLDTAEVAATAEGPESAAELWNRDLTDAEERAEIDEMVDEARGLLEYINAHRVPASQLVDMTVEVRRLTEGIKVAAAMVDGWHDSTRDLLLGLIGEKADEPEDD